MYKVLIVDDEKYIRLWIKNCIDWNRFGFEISGEADNGYDALAKIDEIKPDLVISDMNMPELDGVELMEKAGRIYPDILFAVLSGYKDFEYMRSAVKNNAVDYLLKPVKAEEIISVLENIRIKLERLGKKQAPSAEDLGISSDVKQIKNTAVEKAKRFIDQNYKEEISLADISNHVHMTPNYFCALFKSETNQNLFDYIINFRIEKAKALMKDEGLKTYKIGEMVGYKDPKYFCRVFKKVTGLSPSDYRKSISII